MRLLLLAAITLAFITFHQQTLQAQDDMDTTVVFEKVSGAYISGGLLGLGDDISGVGFTGFSVSIGYESRLNNIFFVRYGVRFGQQTKWDQSRITSSAGGLNQELMDLGYGSGTPFVRNYQNAQLGVELFLGANLITFGNSTSYLTFYPIAGIDLQQRWISHDALDGNGSVYDYSSIDLSADDYVDQLEDLSDGDFETSSPNNGIGMYLVGGLGARYQVSPGFGLGVEYRTGFSFSDTMDGFEANERNDGASWIQLQVYFPL